MDSHAVVVVDREGVIRYWSPGAEALFGHAAADCEGEGLDVIVPEEYRERHWAAFHAAINRGTLRFDPAAASLPVRCGDGQVARFPGRLSLLRDAYNNAVGAVGIFSSSDARSPSLPELA